MRRNGFISSALTTSVIVTLLTACISVTTPPGSPSLYGAQPRGHRLATSEVVAVFVSKELVPLNGGAPHRSWPSSASDPPAYGKLDTIRPISNGGATERSFLDGFQAVRPDVRIVVVDEQLRLACFGVGSSAIELQQGLLVVPNLAAPQCRAAVDQRGIRYLLSVTGQDSCYSFSQTSASNNSIDLAKSHLHVFELYARTFDTQSGVEVCQDVAWEVAKASEEFSLIGLIPFANATTIDEPAYWARVAWLTGARAGTCFVAPPKAEPGKAEATR